MNDPLSCLKSFALKVSVEIFYTYVYYVNYVPHYPIIESLNKNLDYEDNDVESEAEVDENGNWVMITRGQKCGPIKTTRVVDGNKLTLTTTIVDKKISCVRYFDRQ